MPDVAIPRGGAAEAVAAALGAHPGATAAVLAEAAGVGQSTAAKALAALEAEGRATRNPGGRADSGRRQPDRWSPPDPVGGTGSDPSVEAGAGEPPEPSKGGDGRLGRGELAGLVLGYLAERPGEAVGPAAVAKALGRSAGAVSNALGRLADAGTVRRVGDSPRRYRLTRR
ncbi:MAG TPA: winged helix-turn-helix domain-containing protein [Acidimicrobiales bacterium]|nr:winged helix-turn-helix domain-containing protein [Acidimicrobiales bacterium]